VPIAEVGRGLKAVEAENNRRSCRYHQKEQRSRPKALRLVSKSPDGVATHCMASVTRDQFMEKRFSERQRKS